MRLVDLEEKMKEKGLRNIDIAREHSVSEKAVSEWKRGKNTRETRRYLTC